MLLTHAPLIPPRTLTCISNSEKPQVMPTMLYVCGMSCLVAHVCLVFVSSCHAFLLTKEHSGKTCLLSSMIVAKHGLGPS